MHGPVCFFAHPGVEVSHEHRGRLAEVQKRREPAVKVIQRFQGLVQDRVVRTALDKDRPFRLPLAARLILKLPWVRDIPARLVAFGIRRARIDPALTGETGRAPVGSEPEAQRS